MPDLRNLWINPEVKLLSDEPVVGQTDQKRQARVQVTGLMCYSL